MAKLDRSACITAKHRLVFKCLENSRLANGLIA